MTLLCKHEVDYLYDGTPYPTMYHETDVENGELYEYIYPQIKDSEFIVVTDNPNTVLHDPDFSIDTYRKTRYCYTFS